ncbi:hypothetical protein [Paenibacillus macerans]|uniref:hypothetical protein n=1 Tax=Paenibacillus macerans TaxID=44252 RepID=UPI003D31CB50
MKNPSMPILMMTAVICRDFAILVPLHRSMPNAKTYPSIEANNSKTTQTGSPQA